MKYLTGFIIGALLSTAFHYERDVQANEPEIVLVHTEQDVCGYDDVGLKRLTVDMIEGTL